MPKLTQYSLYLYLVKNVIEIVLLPHYMKLMFHPYFQTKVNLYYH
ncbi:hypothetical protein M111_0767 [Bacteroides fragilis str. 3986T(B)10]|nr:hypothetical protein M111_0767 [Bacteroides fragilis str. 3986T(B)10]EXY96878.1 hypothetical protein M081_0889 [Bacteroides fragilis str. 3998 T(B) 4]